MERPGPGSYSPAAASGRGMETVKKGAMPTSSFAKPRKFRDEVVPPKELLPGPGEYDLTGGYRDGKTIREIGDEMIGSSFFKDRMKRFKKPTPQTEQVCPGTYEVAMADESMYRFGKKDRKTGRFMPDAGMASGSKRGDVVAKGNVPGPGEYDTGRAERAGRRGSGGAQDEARPTAAFKTGTGGDGKRKDAPTPGPGWYDVPPPNPLSSAAGESSFRSTSTRIASSGAGRVKPPGPAYYDAKPEGGRRTFHFNVDQKWI